MVFDAARKKLPAGTPIGAIDGLGDELVEIMQRAGQIRDPD
jgi:hypothetical protein